MRKLFEKTVQFENLIKDLFQNYGYTIENGHEKDEAFDFIISNGSKKVIVELKIYQTRKASGNLLRKAILTVKSLLEKYNINIKNILLILPTSIDETLKENLKSEFQINIYDRKNLTFLFKPYPSLYKRYMEIISDINSEIYEVENEKETKIEDLFSDIKKIDGFKEEHNDLNTMYGNKLFEELENITVSKEFSKYEKKCIQILKYLFNENLKGWQAQNLTDDGLNRFDLVCRINLGNEFWECLINDFKSKYVLFEFKNYKDKIKQTQIFTTEKYLFQTALRNVAFIISRKGASENAIKSAKGVLRESGKLIINLNDNDLKKMLHMKDRGEEPSDYLFDLLDNFLLKLEK